MIDSPKWVRFINLCDRMPLNKVQISSYDSYVRELSEMCHRRGIAKYGMTPTKEISPPKIIPQYILGFHFPLIGHKWFVPEVQGSAPSCTPPPGTNIFSYAAFQGGTFQRLLLEMEENFVKETVCDSLFIFFYKG